MTKNICFLFLILLLPACSISPARFEFGPVRGRIIDANTNRPVENAEVIVTWGIEGHKGFALQASDLGNIYISSATTDVEGYFNVETSEIVDFSDSEYSIRLKSPVIRVFNERFRIENRAVSIKEKSIGIPLLNFRIQARSQREHVIALLQQTTKRQSMDDVQWLIESSQLLDSPGACENPRYGAFARRILSYIEISMLNTSVPPNISGPKEYLCEGKSMKYYRYYGTYQCNSDLTICDSNVDAYPNENEGYDNSLQKSVEKNYK